MTSIPVTATRVLLNQLSLPVSAGTAISSSSNTASVNGLATTDKGLKWR